MLTRCKRGMFIVSSRSFLEGIGAESLVGSLAAELRKEAWMSVNDVEEGRF